MGGGEGPVDEFLSLSVSCRVKPAIFDLFLAVAIAVYAFSWYLTVQVSNGDHQGRGYVG